jgi:hypothetical protein
MADPRVVPRKLWEHPNPKETAMWKFMEKVNQKRDLSLQVSLVTFQSYTSTLNQIRARDRTLIDIWLVADIHNHEDAGHPCFIIFHSMDTRPCGRSTNVSWICAYYITMLEI